MAVTKIGYAALAVTDLENALDHYTNNVGLYLSDRTENQAYLRTPDEQDHHSLVLRQSDRAGLDRFGIKVGEPDDLAEIETLAERAGAQVRRLPAGAEPGIGEVVAFTLPSEHEVWAYHDVQVVGLAGGMDNPDPIEPDDTAGTIRAQHLDHVALCAPDTDDLSKFLVEVLDFAESEVVVTPEGRKAVSFMYCTNSMHDVAIVPGPGAGLHHVSFYGESRAAIVRAADLLRHRDIPTMNYGLSRHGIAGVTTTYFYDPSGIRNELFFGPYATPGAPGMVPALEWEIAELGRGVFYYENEVDGPFMTTAT
jgi:catechol 2,3-dioxygenase